MAGVTTAAHRPTLLVAAIAITANVVLGVLVQVRRRAPIGITGDIVFSMVWAMPAWLALLAARRRPALLPAGTLLATLFGLAARGWVGLGFLAEATLLLVAWFAWDDGPASRVAPMGVSAVVLIPTVAGALALFAREDTQCYREAAADRLVRVEAARCLPLGREHPGYVESDQIRPDEMVAGLSLAALALGAGWALAAPRPGARVASPRPVGGKQRRR
jgi:hypothetical protein